MKPDPITVPVWYDFASTLCYVAHRVMERIAPALEEIEVTLDWQPLDLSQLLHPYRRGMPMPDTRRASAERVACDLDVEVEVPAVWQDSRAAASAAIALEGSVHAATWRERVFTALFEERRDGPGDTEVSGWIDELGFGLPADALASCRHGLSARTEAAREAMVRGVPTFMLGEWPVGGIQTGETMTHLLRRYVAKRRAGATK